MEILTAKLSKAEELCDSLNEIIKNTQKLEDDEGVNLPKFKRRFDEKSLNKYLEKLTQAVKNPIRFRRKRALAELGVSGIENVKDDIFDDDNIDETIQILKELQTYKRLFKILSSKISSWIIQNSITWVNSQLKDIRDNIEKLKKVEEIRSEDVKDYILQKYINRELSVHQIDEFKEKILKIEEVLNLLIKESEISLINAVYELINEIEEFGEKFEEQYSSLSDAKEGLEKIKEDLKQRYEKIRYEINFWWKLCPEVYVQESKNIGILMNKLKELKDKCKEKHNSFNVLEQLYSQGLHNKIENLEDFAHKLDKVISYLPDIKIKSEEDIDIVRKMYDQLSWLEAIEYPQIEELFKLKNTKDFLEKVKEIKKEHERLKRYLASYQRILGIKEEQIDKYPSLKQKTDEYKKDLQNKIGRGFESLIAFLEGETENIEADEETLRNFVKTIKPLLKEALEL